MHIRETFAESAWFFCKEVLESGSMNVSAAIWYVVRWAEHIGVDLEQNIIWKMRYNKLRPYKHGGKKY